MIEVVSRLPAEYQEVEYIQSTGTQYIDTGVQPTLSTKVMFGINMTEATGYVIVGDYLGDDATDWRIFNASGTAYFDIGTSRVSGGSFAAGTYYDAEFGNHYIKLNDEITAQGNDVTSSSIGTFTIKVFRATSGAVFSKGKLYYLRIYNDKTLLREFIPCYQKSDGKAGLYDLINNKFYANASSGNFTVGANISGNTTIVVTPGDIIPLKYALRRKMLQKNVSVLPKRIINLRGGIWPTAGQSKDSGCRVFINGEWRTSGTFEVTDGDIIVLQIGGGGSYYYPRNYISIDGVKVVDGISDSNLRPSYEYVVTSDCNIVGSYGTNSQGTIVYGRLELTTI